MEHTQFSLTSIFSNTSSNVNYTSIEYYKAYNGVVNSEYTRFMIRQDVTINQESRDLWFHDNSDSSLLDSFDLKQIDRNLFTSQKYLIMIYFLIFICNMKKYFHTKVIEKWIDSNE